MDLNTLNETLDSITMPDGLHVIGPVGITNWPCDIQITNGDLSGRKWRISQHMTVSEVVQTVLAATLAWMEHEVRETFLYQGQKVFSPHHDLAALAVAIRDGEVQEETRL